MNLPAIVVNAFNRPAALSRLLDSLLKAVYPDGQAVPLVISIDRSDSEPARQVRDLGHDFNWPYGPKRVIARPEHLGLVRHFYACGALTGEYGPLVYLEDDLYVSARFYQFAAQALAAYESDPQVAGISLFALWFNGYTHQPFLPMPDESDVFFLQVPYYLGQAFTPQQWQRFEAWQASFQGNVKTDARLHRTFAHFDAEDWFPLRMQYLVDTGRTYVFPREALAVGYGDPGTHFAKTSRFLQAPLQQDKQAYRFKPLADSIAVYDSFFEILPDRLSRLAGTLQGYDYQVDLYGTKSLANLNTYPQAEFVLTSRPACSAQATFGKHLWPLEANIIAGVPGDEIRLARKTELVWGRLADLVILQSNQRYFNRGRSEGKRSWLAMAGLRMLQRLGWKPGGK